MGYRGTSNFDRLLYELISELGFGFRPTSTPESRKPYPVVSRLW